MFVGLDVEIGDDRRLAGHRLNDLGVEAQRFVGIGQVACRGHQKTELGGRLRRPHDKNDIFLGDAGAGSDPQPHGVDAAFEIDRHDHAFGCFPAAIGHRIGMEFDAAELRRIDSKAIVLAVPVPSGHRAHRMIDAPGVEPMRSGVDHLMTDAVARCILWTCPKRRAARPAAIPPCRQASNSARVSARSQIAGRSIFPA